MNSFLKTAIQAAKIAGRIQRKHYGRVRHIQYKSKNKLNLVTEVDHRCEKAVLSILKRNFPSHNFWGEESGRQGNKSEYTWVVDPLDGTTNYTHGYPFFCCSIALIKSQTPLSLLYPKTPHHPPLAQNPPSAPLYQRGERGDLWKRDRFEPIIGVIYDPLRDECFTAEKGRGAFLNGKRLKVSGTPTLAESLLCTGFAYAVRETHYNLDNFQRFVLKSQGVRRDGSAALNLAYLAAGRFDGFWERGIQVWDMAAAVLMIQEAGGKVTDITGRPYDLMAENALASNGRIHREMFKVLKSGKDEKVWALKWANRPRPK